MSVLFGNCFTGPAWVLLGVAGVGLIAYLATDIVRSVRGRRKLESQRQRQRREFWGYE